MMKHPRVLALILAGGEGNRMRELTRRRAKPALPFGGSYRLIDFPLSNCVHSGISDTWVIEQFEPHDLNEHLSNGRAYDLDRTHGGLQILPPRQAGEQSEDAGWHQGNADALRRNRRLLREFDPDLLLVLSSDHVYALDFRDVIEAHLQAGAEATMVTTRVPEDEARRFGNVQADGSGRVTRFAYKPDQPISDIATTEIFVYNAGVLLSTLDELHGQARRRAESEGEDPGQAALQDWGHELLPALVERGRVHAFEHGGYWRDVGTPAAYFEAHMDFLRPDPPFALDDPRWPILTRALPRVPARLSGATVENALISPGCVVEGTVRNSVLCPGARVEAGAVVEECVVLHNAVIRAGARLRRAIVDEGAVAQSHVSGDAEPSIIAREEDAE